jgi:hypothetical protein
MERILRLLGTRYGIALILAVVVLGIVGVTRGFSGSRPAPPPAAPDVAAGGSPSASFDPYAGDDSVQSPEAPPPPVTSPGAATPDTVATNFATAWLHHTGVTAQQWWSGLKPYATQALLAKLKETDPAGVPAERMTGPAQLQNRDVSFVDVAIPLNSGLLRLRLLATAGRWLVDEVDWERG